MNNRIIKTVAKRNKRLGRGYGSGKGGHTVGKGQKGQKTRKKLGVLFEGTKVKKSFIKRLPFLRGKGKFSGRVSPLVIDVKLLDKFPAGSKVDINFLVDRGLVDKDKATKRGVKILGNSDMTKKLTVVSPISKAASNKIIKAGGEVLTGSEVG